MKARGKPGFRFAAVLTGFAVADSLVFRQSAAALNPLMHPRVSIILPTFRRPEKTLRAVQSVLAQTFAEWELIVVASEEDRETVAAIEEIGDERVRCLVEETNLAACAARNAGIDAAHGPYIALLDSDDELLPESIEKRVANLENHPDAALVYSKIRYVMARGVEAVGPEDAPADDEGFVESLVLGKGLATSAMMAPAYAMRECRFDETLSAFQDWDVALRLAQMGPVTFVDLPLSIVHAEDETEGQRITFGFDPRSAEHFVAKHRSAFDASPRAEAAVFYRAAMRAVRTGDRALAREHLLRALDLHPAHGKARTVLWMTRLGLFRALPAALRLRWHWLLRSQRLG